MKISKKELQEIIKEEAMNFKRALELKKELNEIEKQLNEVFAGDTLSSEKQGGVHAGQHKPVFKKKGSALVEDNEEEITDLEGLEGLEELPETGECEIEAEESVEELPMEECDLTAEEKIEEPIAENLDEPIEGESVAQKVEDSKVDDGMEKCKCVNESVETSRMKFLIGYGK
jgi:hypothetical protein